MAGRFGVAFTVTTVLRAYQPTLAPVASWLTVVRPGQFGVERSTVPLRDRSVPKSICSAGLTVSCLQSAVMSAVAEWASSPTTNE